MMKKALFMLAMLTCIFASCSDGGSDEPSNPTPKPEEVKSEITLDNGIVANGLSFGVAQGEQSVSFTTNTNWTLSIAATTGGSTWCKASATSGSKGTANVKFTVTENTDYDDRSVSVTIKAGTASKTFTITQKGADALLVTTKKYEVAQAGGKIEVEVKANIEYQLAVSETAKDWIKETQSKSRALTTKKHTFEIAENEEVEKREGEITVKSGDKVETVKVYQAGGAVLLLSKNEFTVSDAGETITVDIKSNVEYGVQMPDVDWIKDEASNRGMSSHTLKYVIAPNEGYDSRSAEIIFYDQNSDLKDTLKVVQAQKDAIVISEKKINVGKEGGTIEFEVSSNVDFSIELSEDWLKQASDSKGLESKQLRFTIDENTTGKDREATITFVNGDMKQVVTILQNGSNVPYITFTAEAPQTLTMSAIVETLEYSVNGSDWKSLGTTTITFGANNGTLRLRGKSSRGTAYNITEDYAKILFGNDTPVICSGDIRTLVDYDNYENADTSNAKFYALFSGSTCLTSAPELPATTLADYCYRAMFSGCTNLTTAPELPATTLSKNCYDSMFNGCTSLIAAPELPATILADYCYNQLFKGCTSLTNAPELPATNLADYCYVAMFRGCTSLTAAPELPATILADYCYPSMFYGCKNLISAPELPAKTLSDYCYQAMFSGCSSLTTAPALPATTLKEYCYGFMFYGCTNLTTAPELPATTLKDLCYQNMFSGCTSLTTAPDLPAKTLAIRCYEYMFSKCTSLTTTPEKLPATTLTDYCYVAMFSGCTSLTTAPELPATTLQYKSYEGMFSGCKNLNKVTMLATDNVDYNYSMIGWLSGVSSTGTFIKAPNADLSTKGIVPSGWTIVDYHK